MTSVSPSLPILSVLVARVSNKTISVLISLRELQKDNETVNLEALLDSGAGELFIDETFAKRNDFTLHKLPEPLNAYNVDGVMIGFMCTWCVHVFLFLSFLFPFLIRRIHARYAWTYSLATHGDCAAALHRLMYNSCLTHGSAQTTIVSINTCFFFVSSLARSC